MPGLYVRMLLPALLVYKNGSNLHAGTAGRCSHILVYSISYTLLTVVFRQVLTRVFKLPAWVTPALAFTNMTSLPLLLIRSLKQTQTLDVILLNGDTAADALERAGSYFLTDAMVSNSLTFALGPRLLIPSDEDAPDSDGNDDDEANDNIRDD